MNSNIKTVSQIIKFFGIAVVAAFWVLVFNHYYQIVNYADALFSNLNITVFIDKNSKDDDKITEAIEALGYVTVDEYVSSKDVYSRAVEKNPFLKDISVPGDIEVFQSYLKVHPAAAPTEDFIITARKAISAVEHVGEVILKPEDFKKHIEVRKLILSYQTAGLYFAIALTVLFIAQAVLMIMRSERNIRKLIISAVTYLIAASVGFVGVWSICLFIQYPLLIDQNAAFFIIPLTAALGIILKIKMKLKKYTVSAVFLILFFNVAFAQTRDKEIKEQTQQLSDVRKNLRQKQQEKERLMLQEKVFKRELGALNAAIDKAEKKLAKISRDIKTAEKNLSGASLAYNKAFEKQYDWNQAMLDEIELFNQMTFEISYEDDPVEYKIRQEALKYKKKNFDKEKETADISSSDVKKWEKARKDLLELRAQENKLAAERKDLIKEKNALLKTTTGKRTAAEEEIKALNESAKALQALIKKLSEVSKKKQTEQVIRTPAPSVQRKKGLTWPVAGKVTVKFGKNKHPELDTYIISNGIKIKAANFAQVKSVDSGVVVFTGEFRSYGKVVIIDHKDSYFTVYGQLNEILVKEDQKVSKGTVLAKLGKGDESVLYFEIRQDNVPDNPLLWLESK